MASASPHPIFYGVPAETISDLCGVTLRQAHAYKRGTAHAHPSVIQLVTLYTEGRILGDAFAGWASRGADLVDPEGRTMSQSQLRAYAFVWQLARELARQDPAAMESLDRIAGIATARLNRDRKRRGPGASGATARPADLAPKLNEQDARPNWRDLDTSDPAHPPRKRGGLAR